MKKGKVVPQISMRIFFLYYSFLNISLDKSWKRKYRKKVIFIFLFASLMFNDYALFMWNFLLWEKVLKILANEKSFYKIFELLSFVFLFFSGNIANTNNKICLYRIIRLQQKEFLLFTELNVCTS